MMWMDRLLAAELLPDPLIRIGIRRLVGQRSREIRAGGPAAVRERQLALVQALRESPIAVDTEAANEQHYELPAAFFELVLGRHLKYSSAFWGQGVETLDAAEEAMLELYIERAEIRNGQRILELGCGWGSLSLYLAQRFPTSEILAVSNSASQQAYIRHIAERRGLGNVRLQKADINHFCPPGCFDRVVSIEMFEHVRNHQRLFERIADWLEEDGKLFVHIFCHRETAYPFVAEEGRSGDWMARHFFTGGLMPSLNLFRELAGALVEEERWQLSGVHYQRTALAWLDAMDRRRAEILPIFAASYGERHGRRWWVYWRVFFLACAELFGFRGGSEWMVAHYRFVKGSPGPERARRHDQATALAP